MTAKLKAFWTRLRHGAEAAKAAISIASPALTKLVILCLLTVTLNALWWDRYIEPFKGANNIIGIIMDLLVAIVGAYIVYLIIDVYPQYKARRFFTAITLRHEINILADMHREVAYKIITPRPGTHSFDAIQSTAIHSSRTEIVHAVRKVRLNNDSPFKGSDIITGKTWRDVLIANAAFEDKCIDNILTFKEAIDIDFAIQLERLKRTEYRQRIRQYLHTTLEADRLSGFMEYYHDHILSLYIIICTYERMQSNFGLASDRPHSTLR
ncbi:hypothetical protein [Aeromonas hydrophila]|uniref:hypothetical protein n=1 Tax=Aeromonas hydrophila TaxID=644 RepID=UPI003D1C8152